MGADPKGHYDPAKQGYKLLYRPGKVNCCPGCGKTNWHIGRSTAECAFCACVLPLIESGSYSQIDYDGATA